MTTPAPAARGAATPFVDFRNVWLAYEGQDAVAVEDLTLSIAAGEFVAIDEVHSGRGYQSHHGSRLHFGLGRHGRVDLIEVRWIGGGVDVFENIAVDRITTLAEGRGSAPPADPR